MRIPALIALCITAACTSGQANHLGTPLAWPGMVVSSSIDNASYDAKRRKVSAHIRANHPALIREIHAGGGPLLARGMGLARVPIGKQSALRRLLKSDIALYQNDPEALIVALMVHGN